MARCALRRLVVAAGAALLGGSCIPADQPYWVIDHTDALSMRIEVAERGPYGSLEPPSGGPVLEAMPGDRVRITPFIAGPDGPVAPGSLAPRFYACDRSSCNEATRGLVDARPCRAVPVPNDETCFIGQGDGAEFEVGGFTDLIAAVTVGVPVMMIAGTPEGPDTAECVRRLGEIEEQATSLRDCLLFVRTLRIGPAWRALLVAAALGVETPIEPDALPWQVTQIEPDVPPTIASFTAWVPAAGGGEAFVELPREGTLTVRAGSRVGLSLVVGAPPQQYMLLSIDPDGDDAGASVTSETRAAAWFSSASGAFALDSSQGLDVTWQAPEEPGEVFVYVVLADIRSSDVAWFRVEVEPG